MMIVFEHLLHAGMLIWSLQQQNSNYVQNHRKHNTNQRHIQRSDKQLEPSSRMHSCTINVQKEGRPKKTISEQAGKGKQSSSNSADVDMHQETQVHSLQIWTVWTSSAFSGVDHPVYLAQIPGVALNLGSAMAFHLQHTYLLREN